jgi:hypothetical protein
LAQLSTWKAIIEKRYKSDTVALFMFVNGSRISIYATNICGPSAIGRKGDWSYQTGALSSNSKALRTLKIAANLAEAGDSSWPALTVDHPADMSFSGRPFFNARRVRRSKAMKGRKIYRLSLQQCVRSRVAGGMTAVFVLQKHSQDSTNRLSAAASKDKVLPLG